MNYALSTVVANARLHNDYHESDKSSSTHADKSEEKVNEMRSMRGRVRPQTTVEKSVKMLRSKDLHT